MSTATLRLFPKITDAGLDELPQTHRKKIEDTLEPCATRRRADNIRHYAHGIGDDNPLWCDPASPRERA